MRQVGYLQVLKRKVVCPNCCWTRLKHTEFRRWHVRNIVRLTRQVESAFVSVVLCMLAGHTSQRAVSLASPLYFNYDAVIVQRLASFVTTVARTVYTACPSHDFTPCLCNKMSFSSSSYSCHGVGPLVAPFQSHVSRSLFKGLPWFLLPVGE